MSMGKSSIASILLHSVSSCIGVAIGIGISSIESNLEIYIITGKKYKKIQNGNLLPKLFWPTVRKYCSTNWEGREFAKFLRSLEQFIQTVKGRVK